MDWYHIRQTRQEEDWFGLKKISYTSSSIFWTAVLFLSLLLSLSFLSLSSSGWTPWRSICCTVSLSSRTDDLAETSDVSTMLSRRRNVSYRRICQRAVRGVRRGDSKHWKWSSTWRRCWPTWAPTMVEDCVYSSSPFMWSRKWKICVWRRCWTALESAFVRSELVACDDAWWRMDINFSLFLPRLEAAQTLHRFVEWAQCVCCVDELAVDYWQDRR